MTVAAKPKVHHGRNIMRLREGFNRMTQDALGQCVGYSQSQISKLEDLEHIEDDVLVKFAKLFGYTLEDIRDNEVTLVAKPMTVNNNTFEDGSVSSVGNTFENGSTNNLVSGDQINNPLDEVLKLCKEKETLFEQMLKNEQERNTYLIKLFEDIDRRLGSKR